jgi:ATP-binding cassette subfamily F protein 3
MKHIAKLRNRLRDLDPKLKTAAFQIPCPVVHAGPAVRCVDLAIGYGEKIVARDINLEIPRGAKAAIVGENGRGKSTLLRTMVGALPPIAGNCKWWHKADIGYYSQLSEETLSHQETVLDALNRAAPAEASGERILATAGAFLFGEDDLEKPCGVLSGGERARVRLARLILHEHSVLVLDEPTNHLDAETVEVLAKALKEYAGTVLVVSHARTFMNALVDRIYEVRGGTVRHYTGTYEDYVADLAALAAEANTVLPVVAGTPGADTRREKVLADREERRARQKLEDRLKSLEKEKGRIMAYFFENPTDYAPDKAKRLSELEEEIDRTENDWLKLAD